MELKSSEATRVRLFLQRFLSVYFVIQCNLLQSDPRLIPARMRECQEVSDISNPAHHVPVKLRRLSECLGPKSIIFQHFGVGLQSSLFASQERKPSS